MVAMSAALLLLHSQAAMLFTGWAWISQFYHFTKNFFVFIIRP